MNTRDVRDSIRPGSGLPATKSILSGLWGKLRMAPQAVANTRAGRNGHTFQLNSATLLLALLTCAGVWTANSANVSITGASGGTSISADAATGAYTTLGAITIAETANGDIKTGSSQTMTLKVPAGYEFNTAQTPNVSYTAGRNITAASAAFSDSTTLVITFSVGSNNLLDTMVIGGTTAIQVRPTAGTPLATGKHIYCSAQSLVTAGITTSTDGSSGSNFGNLTEVAGAIDHYAVSGTTAQNAGVAFTVTVTALDQFSNTVTTDSSTAVAMAGSTGNVQYDGNDDGVYGDNTKTLTSGVLTITIKDITAETVNISATDSNAKSGTLSSVVISANPPANSYRSAATGTWATLATWQRWNGSAWATPTAGEGVPNSSSGSITIRSPNVVTVAAAASADQLSVESGATLTVNNTLTVANGAGTDLDIFGTVNGTSADTISAASTTVVVENGGSLNAGNTGADLAISGTLTVAGGAVTTASAKGISGAGTLFISGGTVTVGQTSAGGSDFKMTGTLIMSGGTLKIWHDFKNITPSNITCTGGTIEFAGSAGNGFVLIGTYHLFNVVVDSGVNPDFDHNTANVIAIAGSLTLNGGVAVPFPTGNGSTAGSLFFGAVQQAAGTWAGSGALNNNSTYFSGAGQVTVAGAAPSKLAFTTAAYTGGSALTAGTTSGTMTVQRQDSAGNPAVVTAGDVTVNLSSDSTGTKSFRDNATGSTTITSVTIPTGSSTASFRYNDQQVGTPTLTAAASGLTSATQQETVNPVTGDFQSHQTGDWSDTATWERWNGTAWVYPAPFTPTSSDGAIDIRSDHMVTVTANVAVDQAVVQAGGKVIVATGVTLTLGNGNDLLVNKGGKLIVHGFVASAGALTVWSGVTLGGNGTISNSVTVASGGTVAPGASVGTLTVAGDVTFESGSTNAVEVGSGNAIDRLNVTGTLTLNDAVLDIGTLTEVGTNYVLASAASIVGTFGGLTNNSPLPAPNAGYYIHYATVGSTDYIVVNTTPLSTAMDISLYASADGVTIELWTTDESGSQDIVVYASIGDEWVEVGRVPAGQVVGEGSNRYLIAADGLSQDGAYAFKVIDEAGHVHYSNGPVAVQSIRVEAVRMDMQTLMVTFNTEIDRHYVVMVSTDLLNWATEFVSSPTATDWSSYSAAPFTAGQAHTQVRVPVNGRARAFFKAVRVD